MWPANQSWWHQSAAVDGDARQMRPLQFANNHLPSRVDLRPHMTPVEDQADMSTCAANAFAGACEYIIKRQTGKHINVSRLFIYYNGQMIDQRSLEVADDGASKQNTVLGMRKFGICEEHLWPYDEELLNKEPSPDAYDAASRVTVVPLKLPRNLVAMKTCLANQVPFLIGIKLLPTATSEVKRNQGYISMPDPSSSTVASTGTHAVLVVGYDDRTEHFLVRNSWGRDWGMNGYFYIPYQYLIEKRLINYLDGLWAITNIIPRTSHKPTVRRLVVPGHNFDEQHRKDKRHSQMLALQRSMMTMQLYPNLQTVYYPTRMPRVNRSRSLYWYR
ncbi:unnamed protein product [Rotaria magnacalcarata]|uniref:Peptidase C1A papain C-terminal domain-containing protein n=1 Tax=Rotaria magnacalcarata TaxID=392030 RepID=A0A815SUQ2_9BILA|nr:unnamed protein product [Rotaria magnacalcarata]CAF1627403.1 unnamed protein product [Rotaria magnacalcarata]CAF2098168.1 unnamed protein product [Rotaria magnacalcarata]CAF2143309.1 unnamed protein product [Rotaria magnacalcarata]CAF3815241.1 unnamed protein product [Rotaria magnacalcarata]